MEQLAVVTFYKGCLIFGIVFSILTLVFGDFLDEVLDGIFDAVMPGDIDGGFSLFVTFLSVFGGVGLLFSYNTSLSVNSVIILSILIGLVISCSFYFFYLKPMKESENSVAFSLKDLVGKKGEVTILLEPDKYGEVVVQIGAGKTNQIAKSSKGETIAKGIEVKIDEVKEGILYVSMLEKV